MQVMVASIYRGDQSTVPIYVKYVFVPPTRLYMHVMAQGSGVLKGKKSSMRRRSEKLQGGNKMIIWDSVISTVGDPSKKFKTFQQGKEGN